MPCSRTAVSRLVSLVVFVGAMMAGGARAAAEKPMQVVARYTTTQPVTYEVLEWTIDPGRQYDNPFDPDQIAIDAAFTAPSGKQFVLPAFWSADARPRPDRGGSEQWDVSPVGGWLVRACLPEPGDWTMTVTAKDGADTRTSAPLRFHVAPSKDPGFIRRGKDSDRHLQFDSGKPYFAVGLNVGWAGRGGTEEFRSWFSHLAGAGGNFARVWMWRHSQFIENGKTGPGRYDLASCAYYDDILKLAGERGIACMLTFGNHSQLLDKTYWGTGGWPADAYNSANGGPATRPANYFDAGDARSLYKRRLRYIVARYSAFTSVMAWELWNEQDVAEVKIPLEWTREMAGYLHAIDPYHHLVTTSFAGRGDKATWSLPQIDLTQTHLYGDEGSFQEMVGAFARAAASDITEGKPWLLAEFGISWRNNDTKFDAAGKGTNVHNGLWAGTMLNGLGGGCTWWWDNYIEPKQLWHLCTGLSRFAATIDWPRQKFEPVAARWPRLPGTAPETFSDLILPASGTWGKADPKPLTMTPEGELSGALPGYLYGPGKPDLRGPIVLNLDLPKPCRVIVTVLKVSTESTLRMTVDNEAGRDFPFSALPNSPRQVSTTQQAHYNNWLAEFDAPCAVDVPEGAHSVSLENVAGDWMAIKSVTITGAKSSLIPDVRPMVLQGAATGYTIAWLQDVHSGWYEDGQGIEPRAFKELTFLLPVSRPGRYTVEWWDTRLGTIVQTGSAEAAAGTLTLHMPPFSRDIALRAFPLTETHP